MTRNGPEKGHVVAFASHKGGVGKTTVALLASHHIAKQEKKKVLLIDADLVGTSVAVLFDPTKLDQRILKKPLAKIMNYVPVVNPKPTKDVKARNGTEPFETWFKEQVVLEIRGIGDKEFAIISSYDRSDDSDFRDRFARIVNAEGAFVQGRFSQLLEVLRDEGFFVVVDLPPFHVGFARLAIDVIEETAIQGDIYWVVSPDARDLFNQISVYSKTRDNDHLKALKAKERWDRVVINELVINESKDAGWLNEKMLKKELLGRWIDFEKQMPWIFGTDKHIRPPPPPKIAISFSRVLEAATKVLKFSKKEQAELMGAKEGRSILEIFDEEPLKNCGEKLASTIVKRARRDRRPV